MRRVSPKNAPPGFAPRPPTFPGEVGFKSLTAKAPIGLLVGWFTGCWYEFPPGMARLVDRRDLPGLPRQSFEEG